MSDPVARLNAALEGRYAIERELGEDMKHEMSRRVLPLIIGSLLFPLGCGEPTGPVLQPSELCSDHDNSVIATFEDPNLERAVRTALMIGPLDDLTCELLSGLTALFAEGAEIASLVGIQNFATGGVSNGLEILGLGANSITDLSPLSGLTSLEVLSLNNNSITDLSPLSGLTSLTLLNLAVNSITDLSPLSGLTSLETLSIVGGSIADLSPLSGLTSLTFVHLHGSSITDLGPLSGLTGLWLLGLGANSITDLSPLSGLTSLDILHLRDNPDLTNIQPLFDNTGLGGGDRVDLTSTNVSCTDVTALEAKGVTVTSDCP